MAKFVSLVSEVVKKMNDDNKVTTLTFQQTAEIDHNLAIGLKKAKNEFEVKEKSSREYVYKKELSSYRR